MTARPNDVWDLIRSADPLKSIDVTGAVDGSAAQDLLRRIATDDPSVATASGQGVVNVLTLLDHVPRRVERRRRGVAGRLAAAVVVVVVVVAGTAVWRQHRGTQTVSPDRQTTAAGYSKALLSELPLPSGARVAATAPIPELKQSPYTGNGIRDAHVAWWAVTTSFSAAVASFNRLALPVHWKITASSTGGAGPSSNGWVIEVRDPRARFVSSVTVVIAAHAGTTGLLAQVDTYAIPVRTPAQIIAPSADAITFTIRGPGRASYGGISGPRVALLARQVNAAPTYVMLTVISCPAEPRSVTVTFRSGSRSWSLQVSGGNALCNTPSLTGTSGAVIDLTLSQALLTDVCTALGLPSNYLNR